MEPRMAPIESSYRRFLLDMHIPDWDQSFLRRFDPEHFLDLAGQARVATVTVPANGHHGLAFWPAGTGPRHGAPGAADFLPRLLAGAARRGLNRVVYYCTSYVNWYWETHPPARIVDAAGVSRKVSMPGWPYPRRFAICCLNDPGYRSFVLAQLTELASRYEFEGMNLDMMFWPGVCYCPSCTARFAQATGAAIPRTIDWAGPLWARFAALRRDWLAEFIEQATATVLAYQPRVRITHQSQMYTQEWMFGGSARLADATAWLAADLYRDSGELSFDFKLFHGLSRRRPFEQISSWSWPDVHEHVLTRSAAELADLASLAIMNDAAITFLDQPDPDGGLTEHMYPVIGAINERLARLEPFLGGEACADAAIYVSFEAGFDHDHDGEPVSAAGYALEPGGLVSGPTAHRRAARSAAAALRAGHVPFSVITRRQLAELSRWQVLILPNVTVLDDAEIAAFRDYVAAGGGLYASGRTSLFDPAGRQRGDLGLAGLLGVSYLGQLPDVQTFLSPTPAGQPYFAGMPPGRPLTLPSRQQRTRAAAHAEVLATVTRAWTDPQGERYASIIANPPGRPTGLPALVASRFGAGRSVYSAGVLEAGQHRFHHAVLLALVRSLARRDYCVEVQAPSSVEVMLYDQPGQSRMVAHLLEVGQRAPAGPIRLSVRLDGRTVREVRTGPDGQPTSWTAAADRAEISGLQLDSFQLVRIDYTGSG
jgi:Hypothetical glycosyl hydrolase 6